MATIDRAWCDDAECVRDAVVRFLASKPRADALQQLQAIFKCAAAKVPTVMQLLAEVRHTVYSMPGRPRRDSIQYAIQAPNPGLANPRPFCYSHVRALSWTARTRRRILCTCAERPTLAPASCTATTCTPVRPTWLEP